MKNLTIQAIGGLVGWVILSLLVAYKIFPVNPTAVWQGDTQSGVRFILVFAGTIFLPVFLLNLIVQPSVIHQKQENEIKQLKDTYENQRESLQIEPFNYKETNQLVGLQIYNPNWQKVTHLRVGLHSLSRFVEEDGRLEPQVKEIDFHTFPHNNCIERDVVLHDEKVFVAIANLSQDGNISFLTEIPLEKSAYVLPPVPFPMPYGNHADYEIELSITGYVNDVQVLSQTFTRRIHYQSGFPKIEATGQLPRYVAPYLKWENLK